MRKRIEDDDDGSDGEEGDGGAHVAENGGKISCYAPVVSSQYCNCKYSKVGWCTTSSMDVVR